MADRPYSRHYWEWADEYPELHENDATCALWYRLVRLGDMAWPSAATLPVGTKVAALRALTDADLIRMVTKTTYKVRGMDKEREARSQSASNAARTRWGDATRNAPRNAEGTPNRNAETMPSRAEPSKAEPSRATAREPDAFDVYQRVTGSWPSVKVTPWLSSLVDDYAEEAVCEALIAVTDQDPTRATLMSRVRDRLAADAHREAREAEERRQRADAEYQRQEKERTNGMTAVKLPPFAAIVKDMS